MYYGDAPRPPSYFKLELEEPEAGRVLRFDSLSKILSAGIRIGFASGPAPLLDAIDRHVCVFLPLVPYDNQPSSGLFSFQTSTSNLQTSTLTQVIIHTLLKSWGYEGFITHTRNVAAFYRHKRDVFETALEKHLSGLAEWSSPQAGMFFWYSNQPFLGTHVPNPCLLDQQV